jgi:L-arabinose isomerase
LETKPKIGILFFTSGWFRDVGLQDSSFPLTGKVNTVAHAILARLSAFLDPVCSEVIFSAPEAIKAAEKIRNARVDGIIISPLLWCEDQIIRAALKQLNGIPILVCTFFPERSLPDRLDFHDMLLGSGSVGSLQISGVLKREGLRFQSVSGYYLDDGLYGKIRDHCRAFLILGQRGKITCGVLPFRCEHMSATFVDEFALRSLYGIELKYLELHRLREGAQKISIVEIDKFENLLKTEGWAVSVDRKDFIEGIRYALAMERIMAEEGISILAMNDIIEEMHRSFGLRPCLTNPRLSGSGVVVAMEADIPAGTAMYFLRLFTGESPFYTEIFSADLEKNALLMGHAGYHDSTNHDPEYQVAVVPDIEYVNSDPFSGACTYFKYKPGPVTAVNCVYTGAKLKMTAFEGNSLPGPPILEGNCHLFCQLELPVEDFYNRTIQSGVSQHWIVVPGQWAKKLKTFCEWLNIEYFSLV